MSDYINKVKTADGQEYDVQDKRIEAIYTQAEKEKLSRVQEVFTTEEKAKVDAIEEVYSVEEKEKLANLEPLTKEEKIKIAHIDQTYTSVEKEKLATLKAVDTNNGRLNISKVNGLEPIAEFDGIKYYHKREFNLSSLVLNEAQSCWDLLSGEDASWPDYGTGYIQVDCPGPSSSPKAVSICLSGKNGLNNFWLFNTTNPYITVNYTSRVFTIVQTPEEVGSDDSKICLHNCTAYYGYLDGTTFISYWNEEGDDSSLKPITKISDGINEVDIHDSRLTVTSADIGKVVGVNENGELALINAPSSEIKFYEHTITIEPGIVNSSVYFINTSSTPIDTTSDTAIRNARNTALRTNMDIVEYYQDNYSKRLITRQLVELNNTYYLIVYDVSDPKNPEARSSKAVANLGQDQVEEL